MAKRKQHDERRDALLRNLGFEILRFEGFRVTQDREGVRKEIEQAIESCRREHTYAPSPPTWPGENLAIVTGLWHGPKLQIAKCTLQIDQ